jgi:dolichol-phosphate mannosyltransferase
LTVQEVPSLRLSIVVPVKNEIANIAPLIAEIETACAGVAPFEIVYVDDGSTDGTAEELARLAATRPHLRVLHHDRSCGQSIAVRSGVLAARAPVVATLDGDGQNDPVFIPDMVATLLNGPADAGLVQGQRVGRKDSGFKRTQSRIANRVRRWILRDATRDTGCGLKVFYRDVYLALPFFKALHRFMPALVTREGRAVLLLDVVDRPRLTGTSNYGFFDRLWVGIVDLVGVRWLIARRGAIPIVVEDKNAC